MRVERMIRRIGFVLVAAVVTLGVAGCRITKSGNGSAKDVSIETPLGNVHAKSDGTAVMSQIGLPPYPGAVPVPKKENEENNGAADVNLSFGDFRLRVVATTLQSGDDASGIEAFYRKALGQYSDVITCRNNQPVGMPEKTGLGLTCQGDDRAKSAGIHVGSSDEIELKAGSATRQHIVSVRDRGAVRQIGLVSLELPATIGN